MEFVDVNGYEGHFAFIFFGHLFEYWSELTARAAPHSVEVDYSKLFNFYARSDKRGIGELKNFAISGHRSYYNVRLCHCLGLDGIDSLGFLNTFCRAGSHCHKGGTCTYDNKFIHFKVY